MKYYVYALIDPRHENRVFYVGKGCGRRPDGHFRQLANAVDERNVEMVGRGGHEVLVDARDANDDPAKIEVLRDLLAGGYSPQQIVRIVARELSDHASKTIESFLISHAFGLRNLKNLVHGENAERFRPAGDWRPIRHLADQRTDGSTHVYVLRDPVSGEVFYVGQGTGNRINEHFRDARNGRRDSTKKLDKIRDLLGQDLPQSDIAKVIARFPPDETERIDDAFDIESISLKFIYGLDLTNQVRGRYSGRFRSRGGWRLLPGFDLPYILNHGERIPRDDLLHQLLGDGLDVVLMAVCMTAPAGVNWSDAKVLDSGELGREALVGVGNAGCGTYLKIFVRSKKIQLELRWRTVEQREWMRAHFIRLGAYPLKRTGDVFIPMAWRGAANMTADQAEVTRRLGLMLKLTSLIGRRELSPDEQAELLGGLPWAGQDQ